MTNDLLLSTEGPMGYPISPRGVITMHVAYTSVSRQAVVYTGLHWYIACGWLYVSEVFDCRWSLLHDRIILERLSVVAAT